MKKLIYQSILAAGCVYLYSGYANAACTQNPNFRNIQVNVPSATYNIQYDDTTARDLGSFDVRYLSAASTNTYGENTSCGNSYLYGSFVNSWTPNNYIAPSNIPGIGITVATGGLGGNFNRQLGPQPAGRLGWIVYDTIWHITIKKTGQVTSSGSIRSGSIAQLTQTNTGVSGTWYLTTLNMPANAIRINVLSCSLKNSVPTINLGDWYDTQFPAIGSTSTEVDIPITLSCLAGTNIKATVTATSGTVNATQGQLALSGADRATGVAIQLVDQNNNPIPLGSKRTIKNNAAAGDYIFGWKARYIKTADKITPGSADGTATINIRYE
ncbi:fimbrial protein [Providencia rettgeri]|uniref:fimbrial protein n=1 Tax=Providencia rettgeri TaxID=587 RepID=UPI0034E0AE32